MKSWILSKIKFLQYLSGLKQIKKTYPVYKNLKNIYVNQQKNQINQNKYYVNLPNLSYYYKYLKKFIFSDPKNCESVNYFLNSKIKIITENYNYKSINKKEVILVCLIKNDMEKIEEFIKYYEKIGIKYFVFIDNNSTDGTNEYLKSKKNVNLYLCDDEYSTLKREGWLNKIYSHIGFNRWILCVDSDELFTYINQEKYNINKFISSLPLKITRVRSILIDMYSKDSLFQYKKYKSFQKEFCFFDNEGYWEESTFRTNMIFGGPRKRIFSSENKLFKCALSKYPLFYYTKGDYQGSSHWLYPYYKNKKDIYSALRHYKFTNSDMSKYEERVRKGNYALGSYEYKRYFDIIKNNKKISFYYDKSKKYTNSTDLLQLNIDKKVIKTNLGK